MLIGYARTSTLGAGGRISRPNGSPQEAGCERVFAEQISSLADRIVQLQDALDYIREGDVLVVTKLDRLARSMPDLLDIVAKVEERGFHSASWP